jgi:hypothetical protein
VSDAPKPHELEGTVFVSALMERASYLIGSDATPTPYADGIIELMTDVTGMTDAQVRAILFPPLDPFAVYAAEIVGANPEDASDWERVAQVAYEELQDAQNLPLLLRAEVQDALGGDSNDAEHDALVSVADHFNIEWTSYEDRDD